MTLGTLHDGTPLTLTSEERRRHIYISGQTGTGKSTLMLNMMLDDFKNGRPFALLDPHGDLAQRIADSAPQSLTNRTIYFDPQDESHVVGYSPLQQRPIADRDKQTDNIVTTFRHLWIDTWGPRLEYILYHAVRLLIDNQKTLLSLPQLLIREHFVNQLLRGSTDPYTTLFWRHEFPNMTDRLRADAIAPIQNKVGQITGSATLRAVFGQRSTIDLPTIMNDSRYLIVNLSKTMGEAASHTLGAFLTTAFAQAAQSRATIPEESRVDFTLYCDEFQNFATDSFTSILSEARKYRLNLVLANQFISQLPESLRAALLGNAGTIVSFRVGADDAPVLARQFDLARPAALSDTPNHSAWVRTTARGVPSSPLYMETAPASPPLGRLPAVLAWTRAHHARPRGLVEKANDRELKRA